MSSSSSLSKQARRRRERLSDLLLHLTGVACFGAIKWHCDRVTHRSLGEDIAKLLQGSDAAAELTVTCELLFLRHRDRVVAADHVDGLRLTRLIQLLPEDRYTVIDRYVQESGESASCALAPDSADWYTISLFDAQYLGPDGFDRAGLRLTLNPRQGVSAQAFTRRGDALAEALRADPALNLHRACRYIEHRAALVPDAAAVTKLLETEQPLPYGCAI